MVAESGVNIQKKGSVGEHRAPSTIPINRSVEGHFHFFKGVYDRASGYKAVKKAKAIYFNIKSSMGFLNSGLSKVEALVEIKMQRAVQCSAQIYEHYLYSKADQLVGYYTRSVESSRQAIAMTRSKASAAGSLWLALALVVTQMGLIVSTTVTNFALNKAIATKSVGGALIKKVMDGKVVIEQRTRNAMQLCSNIIRNPMGRLSEYANFALDTTNAAAERLLGPSVQTEDSDLTFTKRILYLALRLFGGIGSTAVPSCQKKLDAISEQLAKCMILVDYLKHKKEWTFQKADQLTISAHELRIKVEAEARAAYTSPEEVLIRSIRASSAMLNEQLQKLHTNANELLSDSVKCYLHSAAAYMENLDRNFATADNIYQVKDEVVEEAKQKLQEIAQWSSTLVRRQQT